MYPRGREKVAGTDIGTNGKNRRGGSFRSRKMKSLDGGRKRARIHGSVGAHRKKRIRVQRAAGRRAGSLPPKIRVEERKKSSKWGPGSPPKMRYSPESSRKEEKGFVVGSLEKTDMRSLRSIRQQNTGPGHHTGTILKR